jgi:hypothetical protein
MTPGSLSTSEQTGAIRAAARIARTQEQQLRQELDASDQALALSRKMMEMLTTILDGTDAEGIRSAMIAFARGGKQESFSSLARSAAAVMEKGLSLRRRALGMDPSMTRAALPGAPQSNSAEIPEQVKSLLPSMSIEELLQMRQTAELLQARMKDARNGVPLTIAGEIARDAAPE